MQILRILTNNAVVILGENKKEQIVCGKGIAYKKRPGDNIDTTLINQVFSLQSEDMNIKFQQLLLDIPIEEINIADEIITKGKMSLGKKIDDSIYVSLSDHIHMAIHRYLDGVIIKNALLWDIKQFYADEFAIGLYSLRLIEEKLGVTLPEDEAGFIALHFANASLHDGIGNQEIYKITRIMQEILNIVKYTYRVDFNTDSVYYYRFITHLKFFAQRLVTDTVYQDDKDNELYEAMVLKHPNESSCVNKIAGFIKDEHAYILTDEEKLYLMIHLKRVMEKNVSV